MRNITPHAALQHGSAPMQRAAGQSCSMHGIRHSQLSAPKRPGAQHRTAHPSPSPQQPLTCSLGKGRWRAVWMVRLRVEVHTLSEMGSACVHVRVWVHGWMGNQMRRMCLARSFYAAYPRTHVHQYAHAHTTHAEQLPPPRACACASVSARFGAPRQACMRIHACKRNATHQRHAGEQSRGQQRRVALAVGADGAVTSQPLLPVVLRVLVRAVHAAVRLVGSGCMVGRVPPGHTVAGMQPHLNVGGCM